MKHRLKIVGSCVDFLFSNVRCKVQQENIFVRAHDGDNQRNKINENEIAYVSAGFAIWRIAARHIGQDLRSFMLIENAQATCCTERDTNEEVASYFVCSGS